MKRDVERTIYASRGFFGIGFILLGVLAVSRVAVAHAPAGSKAVGALLGFAAIALGLFRLVQYAHYRRTHP